MKKLAWLAWCGPMALMTIGLVVLFLSSSAWAAEDTEARLLEAEILEVSRGDLDGAMKIYRELIGDDTPANVQARALLNLARCHRKRGELGAAEEILGRLVAEHARQTEIIEEARSFLGELEAGRSDDPRFDWIREVGQSPEIQARIFDLAMTLVDPLSMKAVEARDQLRALGSVTVPILEPMLENSQAPAHRRGLAQVLVDLGHYQHLSFLLSGPAKDESIDSRLYRGWLQTITKASDKKQAQVGSTIESVGNDAEHSAIAALRLGTGDYQRLVADAVALATPSVHGYSEGTYRILELAEIAPQFLEEGRAERLAEMLLEVPVVEELSPGVEHAVTPEGYAAILCLLLDPARSASRVIKPEHLAKLRDLPLNRTGSDPAGCLFERLAQLAREDLVLAIGLGRHASECEDSVPSENKALRAKLARHSDPASLNMLAGLWDDAIPELLNFLSDWPDDNPDHTVVRMALSTLERTWQVESLNLANAMVDVSRTAERPDIKALATATLVQATSLGREDVANRLFEIFREGFPRTSGEEATQDPLVTLFAAVGTFLALPDLEENQSEALELYQHYRALYPVSHLRGLRTDLYEAPRKSPSPMETNDRFDLSHELRDTLALTDSPLLEAYRAFVDSRASRRSKRSKPRTGTQWSRASNATYRSVIGRLFRTDHFESQTGAIEALLFEYAKEGKYLEVYWDLAEDFTRERRLAWVNAIENEVRHSRALEEAIFRLSEINTSRKGNPSPPGLELLSSSRRVDLFMDRRLSRKVREFLVRHQDEAHAAIPWKAVVSSNDPLMDWIGTNRTWLENPCREFMRDGLTSPRETVRRWALRKLPRDTVDLAELVTRFLDDADVRDVAVARALELETTDALPILHRIASDGRRTERLKAIERLPFLADEQSLRPLAGLLEDPDFKVREAALAALESVSSTLQKRSEWKKRVKEGRGAGQ